MIDSSSCSSARPHGGWRARSRLLLLPSLLAVVLLSIAVPAFAGQASTGELFFYPCTDCHPVTMVPGPVPGTEVPSHPLPNGMTGHKIVLETHDALGAGDIDTACLTCHDDPLKNPGKLKIAGGKFVDVKGDVSLVCYPCHEAKYKEFKQGTHGKHFATCVAAGCHDPHTPNYIYVSPLTPYLGTGFQIRAVGADRVPFKPLMSPPLPPPTITPMWYLISVAVGLAMVFAIVLWLAVPPIVGRLKR
jgi:hypothetical protein